MFIVNGTVETEGSAAGSAKGIRTGSAVGLGLVNGVDVLDLASEKGRGTDRLEMTTLEVADDESERGIVGLLQEETAGVGRGVKNEKEEAGARIARETGREAKGWMEKRLVRETWLLRVVSGCWRNMKEKLVRAQRSVGTGTETGIGTADAVTGTEKGVGETGTETGSTRGNGGIERGWTAEKSDTVLYKTTWPPKMTWVMGMREEHHAIWKIIVRMG